MSETIELRWFENTDRSCIQCGKRASGILRGSRNESYGPHCERCANKRLKASKKARSRVKGATLTPLHIRLLRRGVTGEWIGLSDNMGVRIGEVVALGELERMGFVEDAKGPFPPGPPSLPPAVITEAGRAALAAVVDAGRPVPPHGSGP